MALTQLDEFGWNPNMDDAPRDGTRIMIWVAHPPCKNIWEEPVHGYHLDNVYWSSGKFPRWVHLDGAFCFTAVPEGHTVTHWRPQLQPPANSYEIAKQLVAR